MEENLIELIKKKKEFSQLPESLIKRALNLCKNDVKKTRAVLRKYFGVFLTNKVLKLNDENILKKHFSTKNREYFNFYKELFKNSQFNSVIDIGCGINGFSYSYLNEIFPDIQYFGVEAVKQLVDKTNDFFKEKGFENAKIYWGDVFDLNKISFLLNEVKKPTAIFLFQVIDALEFFERDFSKKLLLFLREEMKEEDKIFISLSIKSLSGKKKFRTKREWLREFLNKNFSVEEGILNEEVVFMCKI